VVTSPDWSVAPGATLEIHVEIVAGRSPTASTSEASPSTHHRGQRGHHPGGVPEDIGLIDRGVRVIINVPPLGSVA
jgi:hypothetical protein